MMKILKIGDIIRISKYKRFFAKGYVPNWSEEVFVIKKVKNAIHVISDLKSKGFVGTFYERQLWKTVQKEFRPEKVIKWKGDKLYVKWKGYDSYFNSWIDKKDIVQISEYFPGPKSSGGRVKVEWIRFV